MLFLLQLLKEKADEVKVNVELQQLINKYHLTILTICPTKNLPNVEDLGKPPVVRVAQPMMVPTAAALKMGVGFPLNHVAAGRNDRVLSSHARQGRLYYFFLLFHYCVTFFFCPYLKW